MGSGLIMRAPAFNSAVLPCTEVQKSSYASRCAIVTWNGRFRNTGTALYGTLDALS